MSTIVTRLFDTYEHASMAVTELESNGISHDAISLVANNDEERYSNVVPAAHDESSGTAAGAGLLAGLGMLAIPGVGPVVAAGWLIATAVGAGVGAASGGLLGSLVGAGVSETDAHVYAEGVRRGDTLVTVKAEDDQVAMVERVLDSHNAMDSTVRGDQYRAEGWSKFDETAPAYRAGGSTTMGLPGNPPV